MRHRVTFLPQGRITSTPDGGTLLSAAHWAGVPIESTCGGCGTCGKCRVRLREGSAAIDEADRRFLSDDRLQQGWRLACRTAVHAAYVVETLPVGTPRAAWAASGRTIAVDANVRKVHLRSDQALDEMGGGQSCSTSPSATGVLCGEELIAVEAGDTTARSFGLALDIGTTTVSGAVVNLTTGAVEASGSAPNRQAVYGADVIARIHHAVRAPNGLAELQAALAATMQQLTEELTARSEELYEAVAVGNATMLHLLLGIDPAGIAVSPFLPAFRDALTVRAAEVGLHLHPEARLSTLPLLGAYAGADVVSGLLATDVVRRSDGKARLYLDVGTNSEIALCAGGRALATAAPAGPAFEGAHIRGGMPEAPGAIERVEIGDDVRLGIAGGGPRPVGICGSGLVDAVAELLRCGLIAASGRFASGRFPDALQKRLIPDWGFLLSAPEDGIILTQADLRALQLAKAAIAAGTRVLMDRLGVRTEDLEEVLLAGSFGTYLNAGSARAIGLVPGVPIERIRAVGNAALEGARIALISRAERDAARQMPDHVEYVELSGDPGFNDCFSAALAFPRA